MRWFFMLALMLGAPATASAEGEVHADGETELAPPPKIAVVVAGDPDETIRNTAQFIEQELVLAGMETASDPALRAAMRGAPPTGARSDGTSCPGRPGPVPDR